MAKEASKASAAAEPEAAPARKQPPRAAKTPERVETLRRRRLNTDRDLKNATQRLTKYQNLVLEAFRELDGPATASQVLDAVAEGSSASLASSWRSSARAALAECVAAGRVKLEGDKYSAAGAKRRKAKKAAAEEGAAKKGRKRPEAAKGKKAVVASRKHAPKVVDDDDDAPARKKRKLPAKGVATASKTIPAAAAAVATKKKKGGARDEEKKKNKRSARSESEEEKEEDEEAVVEKKERKRAKPAKPARKAPEKADAAPEGAKESTKSADGPAWEFLDRVWKRYDAEASRLVEDEYQKFVADPMQLDVRSVRSGGWAYQVDFANMKQTNIEHPAHTVRDIRRVVS